MELVQKFFRPARELLITPANEIMANQPLSTETLTAIERFRLNAARFFETFDFDEEPNNFFARTLAAEFARREARDKLWTGRLEKFLSLFLATEIDAAELGGYEMFRLLDDIKRSF